MRKKSTTLHDAVELRRRAEAKLRKSKQGKVRRSVAEAETQRLVHELQVHQIELEMQNEELGQSRAEVEALLHQYTDLYDFAPVGYITLARDGAIHQINLAGSNLLGMARSKLIKRRFGVFVAAQSLATFNTFLEKVFAKPQKETCQIALLKNKTNLLWVRIEAISDALRGQGKECFAVVNDITELVQAEEALRHLSTHDGLTGLYNHSFFVEEMARLERGRKFPVSIVMADVDELKETNDQQGHEAGDALLKRIAQVLNAAFRAEDVIARIGGDEFAVLLPSTDATAAKVSLQRVWQVIQENNAIHVGTPIQLSIGVSTAENPMPLSVVLKEADTNMYIAKRGYNASPKDNS